MTHVDAAGDDDVAAALLLEVANLALPIAGENRRPRPLRIGHRRGHHELVLSVEIVSDPGLVILHVGPVTPEVLERLSAKEEGVAALAFGEELIELSLVALLWIEPFAEHLDRAVERAVLRNDEPAWLSVCGGHGDSRSFVSAACWCSVAPYPGWQSNSPLLCPRVRDCGKDIRDPLTDHIVK